LRRFWWGPMSDLDRRLQRLERQAGCGAPTWMVVSPGESDEAAWARQNQGRPFPAGLLIVCAPQPASTVEEWLATVAAGGGEYER
jgi:hypothetical protein